MEEQTNSIGGMEVFSSPEEMVASEQNAQPQEEAPQQESQPVQEPTQEPAQESTPYVDPEPAPAAEPEAQPQQAEQQNTEPEYSDEDIEQVFLSYASERLGREVTSFDDLQSAQQEQAALDERVAKIAEFVETTGRGPEDWFRYQSLNPSEMDDLTAVRVSLASDYPNLSSDEINLLVRNSYKLDPEKHDAEQVQLSQLQLKVDAEKARNGIAELRNRYMAPATERQGDDEPVIDEQWISTMSEQVDNITGLEFDLGNDKTFTFGFTDDHLSRIKDSNARLEEFFDPFIREDGEWDFDALSSHIAVSQNIDQIVSAAYRQGIGDGQRGIVDKAANVSTASPDQGGTMNESNPLSDQVRNIMRGTSSGLTFKI
jgi:hypothetical protein